MSVIRIKAEEEQRIFDEEVAKIEKQYRPYTASQVARLRPTLQTTYASSALASKLLSILRSHRRNGTAELTFGMIDPILASQMEGQATIYVSGALCAFSAAECIGQDTSDYPWDTAPKAVDRIFRSQAYHDRRQRQDRMRRPFEERVKMEEGRDYYLPIVADADMGFGTTTATMKLVKRLAEAGVAMFHLDDLALAGKRYTGAGSCHTVVSTSEYLKRLSAARLQLDVMGAETLIMCRCDVDGAKFITSDHDPRDHAYILGATIPLEPYATSQRSNEDTTEWERRAGLKTFDDAVKEVASDSELATYRQALSKNTHCCISERRKYARDAMGGKDIFFDWNLPRMQDGRYRFAPCMQTVLDRTLAAAPFGEVTWARMDLFIPKLTEFHTRFQDVYGAKRLFAAGYSATYNFAANGYTPEDVTNLHLTMAKLGIVWHVQPGFAMQGLNYVTKKFSKMWGEEGIGGYLRDVQSPAVEANTDGYEKMEWSGGYLVDEYADILGKP